MRKSVRVLALAGLLSATAASTAFAAQNVGWKQENGVWKYIKADGSYATSEWKKSGDQFFWLDENGDMATDKLIDDGDNTYYVDENGVMITNNWKYTTNDNNEDHWYYFGPNGKAYKKGSSASSAQVKTINDKKYIFNEDGEMQYGWIDSDGEMADDDNSDAWKDAVYYAGDENDGSLAVNNWRLLDVDDDDANDDYNGSHWFYFKSNGKKVVNENSYTVNGKKYGFDENGAMTYDWTSTVATASNATASNAYKYYGDQDSGVKKTGWFLAVPDEDIDPEGYEDGDEVWYYAKSNGEVYKSTIKSINGKKYAFDEFGKMLTGIRAIEFENGAISSVSDELESIDDIKAYDGTSYGIYYFNESGAMAKNSTTLRIDGDSYYFNFASDGHGKNGIYSNCIYVNGRRIEAESDEGLIQVDIDGNEVASNGYLVNTSGKIQKNAKNKKDKDDTYYCTDADGIVTYSGSEKYTEK